MTATGVSTARPVEPRRAGSLLVPWMVGSAGMIAGALLATVASGVLWGLVAATALLAAIALAGVRLSAIERLLIAGGVVASTVLSVVVLPSAPESLDVIVCLWFAAAWLPAAITGALVARRFGSSATVAVGWIVSAALALPAAVVFDVLQPLDQLRRGATSDFGTADYVAISVVLGVLGVAVMLSALTRLPAFGVGAGVVLLTVFAAAKVGFSVSAVMSGIGGLTRVPNFWPPDFGWAIGESGTWWWLPSWEFGAPLRANPLVETFRIGIVATVAGCSVALPLAFLASSLTSVNRTVYVIAKAVMNVTRTVPDLFWAIILVASVGAGPFAGAVALGLFAIAIMSKLLSETIDAADPGPLEAARSTGSRHSPAVRASVFPQVLPSYVAYGLYVFELTIRASVVIGLVGAGGIGRVIEAQRVFYRFDRILAIVIVIVVLVLVIEQVSVALRRRLV